MSETRAMTLEAVAKALRISHCRVAQLEASALRKLRRVPDFERHFHYSMQSSDSNQSYGKFECPRSL